jgi:hypothetical protein
VHVGCDEYRRQPAVRAGQAAQHSKVQNMTKKTIKELTELERKILRHHILISHSITIGLDTASIFPDIHQNDIQKAVSNLEHYGFYGHSNTATRIFTNDGYHESRIYFKSQLKRKQILKPIKTFWLAHWRWIIGIAVNFMLGIIGLYIAWLQLKAPK